MAVTQAAPHVRDGMSVAKAMNWVVVALIPCIFMALFNTGHQANLHMEQIGLVSTPGWRSAILEALGISYDPFDVWASVLHGALYYLPVLAVALIVGELWERVFAKLRKRERGPGLVVVALLFSLSLPPAVPLWQVALGMSFGIVVAKEIFGGLGKNFLNPALAGLAFLYATYPKQMVGETAWTVVEGFTGATAMKIAAGGGIEAVNWAGTNWMQAFLGAVPGAFGATSTLACLLGAALLISTRVASLRVMAGAMFGMIVAALMFNQFVGTGLPFGDLSWHWHLVLGSFAFGVVFLATDPVTAAGTNTGRWIYGILIGGLVVVIRVANVAHPDGVMFAILFGNIVAPLIDYVVMQANIKRRERRSA
ncbi:MAG: NADH:ubiquinone reductase (Na(+)-transporting) subunit B [Hyphomicrobiales bacterium]|nr:NADH:ubiquinone reductase (Na(+)-transporting) subunit B [Hyphomicrobiales bacterium]